MSDEQESLQEQVRIVGKYFSRHPCGPPITVGRMSDKMLRRNSGTGLETVFIQSTGYGFSLKLY